MHAVPDPADVCVGIIANPVSARDIRRIIANAGNLQIAERVNIVMRLLSTLGACGVGRVLMMPDKAGIRAMLSRKLDAERRIQRAFPQLDFLDMDPQSTVEDTHEATRRMVAAGVKALIVLGGDGTHRAVVRTSTALPLAGLSTGTNNAFPEMREPTLTAMAVALYATGRLGPHDALMPNKLLEITVDGGSRTPRRDIALVDAVISSSRTVGARALWTPESLHAVYLAFADPEAIGFSAIGGLLEPVDRRMPFGLAIELDPEAREAALQLSAPIAPGLMHRLPVRRWQAMPPGVPSPVALPAGIVALDGERELPFEHGERVQVTVRDQAFFTVDVSRCLQLAARRGLFHHAP